MTEYRVVKAYRTAHYPNGHINGLGIEFPTDTGTEVLNIGAVTVIAKIRQGRSFYVEGGGAKAYLEIAESDKTGLEYLRTIKDGTPLDNLSALPTEVWLPYQWDTPTKPISIHYGVNGPQLARWWNSTFPAALDSIGTHIGCANEICLPVGFANYYDGNHLVGSIAHNSLSRIFIKASFDNLADGQIMSARITLKLHQTVYHYNTFASNEGSALSSAWQLLGPWLEFVDPISTPATTMITGIPNWGGTIYQEPAWQKKMAASYDPGEGIVLLDVTKTVENWRSGASKNYGMMLLGTDESEQRDNNNSFYSCYEILGIDGDQAYDW